MTELEAQLAQPDGADVRDERIQRLAASELQLRHKLAASLPRDGLSRDEFAAATALADALRAAQEVLAAWPVGKTRAATEIPQSTLPTPRSTPWS